VIDEEFLKILVCPETKQPLTAAPAEVIGRLNDEIGRGACKNRAGQEVREPLDGGLIRQDGQFLYPVRNDIPVMLIDEGIPLQAR
jgi:uncharacterized protein YbaR (Trm112 family)